MVTRVRFISGPHLKQLNHCYPEKSPSNDFQKDFFVFIFGSNIKGDLNPQILFQKNSLKISFDFYFFTSQSEIIWLRRKAETSKKYLLLFLNNLIDIKVKAMSMLQPTFLCVKQFEWIFFHSRFLQSQSGIMAVNNVLTFQSEGFCICCKLQSTRLVNKNWVYTCQDQSVWKNNSPW